MDLYLFFNLHVSVRQFLPTLFALTHIPTANFINARFNRKTR